MPPYPWMEEQQPIGPSNPEQMVDPQPQGPAPDWDRTKFRDAWMSSGVRNVGDMQNWLRTSGWGNQVSTGGSKGDKMYLPGGDVIDAVYAAGRGGNLAGPMWTGAGNWQRGGGQRPQPGQQQPIGPSQGMQFPPMYGGWGRPWMGGGWSGGGGMMQYPMQQQGPNPAMQQNQMHQQFQNRQRMRHPGGMMQGGIGPSYNMNNSLSQRGSQMGLPYNYQGGPMRRGGLNPNTPKY